MLSQLSNLLGLGLSVAAPDARHGQKPDVDFATLFAEAEAEDNPQTGQADPLPDVDSPSDGLAEDAADGDDPIDEIAGERPPRTDNKPGIRDLDHPAASLPSPDAPEPASAVFEESLVDPEPLVTPDRETARGPDPKSEAVSLTAGPAPSPGLTSDKVSMTDPSATVASGVVPTEKASAPAAQTVPSRPVVARQDAAPVPEARLARQDAGHAPLAGGPKLPGVPPAPEQGRFRHIPDTPRKLQVAATGRPPTPGKTAAEMATVARPAPNPAAPRSLTTEPAARPVGGLSKKNATGPDMPIFHIMQRGLPENAASWPQETAPVQTVTQVRDRGPESQQMPDPGPGKMFRGVAVPSLDGLPGPQTPLDPVEPQARPQIAPAGLAPSKPVPDTVVVRAHEATGPVQDLLDRAMPAALHRAEPATGPMTRAAAATVLGTDALGAFLSISPVTADQGAATETTPVAVKDGRGNTDFRHPLVPSPDPARVEPQHRPDASKSSRQPPDLSLSDVNEAQDLLPGRSTPPRTPTTTVADGTVPAAVPGPLQEVGPPVKLAAHQQRAFQPLTTGFERSDGLPGPLPAAGAPVAPAPRLLHASQPLPAGIERGDSLAGPLQESGPRIEPAPRQLRASQPLPTGIERGDGLAGPLQEAGPRVESVPGQLRASQLVPVGVERGDSLPGPLQEAGPRIETAPSQLRAARPLHTGIERDDSLPDSRQETRIVQIPARTPDAAQASDGFRTSQVTGATAGQAPFPSSLAGLPEPRQHEFVRHDSDVRIERRGENGSDRVVPAEAPPPKPGPTQTMAPFVQMASPSPDRSQVSRVTSPFLADVVDETEFPGPVQGHGGTEFRAHSHGSAVHPAVVTRTDPHPVLRQIVDGVARMRDGGVELQLSPEELGRVRMQMVPGESGLAVHITADRPETLDLMRRNIDQLARDLADAGYGGAEFTFGGNGGGNDDRTPRGSPGAVPQEPAERNMAERAAVTPVTDGLDIRI